MTAHQSSNKIAAKGETVGMQPPELSTTKYAIAAFCVNNGNGRLDTDIVGKSKEPFGFSGNSRVIFGPPS
jgi:uncharacterized protein (DUF2141 family)